MELLLTILSVLAVWAFLFVLVLGLWCILKPLESIRAQLQKIAMGVRAIEQETQPLGEGSDALGSTLKEVTGAVIAATGTLSDVERNLAAAVPALRARS